MSKIISYDFNVDSLISVEAPIGTDPDTLIEQVLAKLITRAAEKDLTITFEDFFDKETGVWDNDWEGYANEQR
jgi:hypothetical protein